MTVLPRGERQIILKCCQLGQATIGSGNIQPDSALTQDRIIVAIVGSDYERSLAIMITLGRFKGGYQNSWLMPQFAVFQ